MDYDFLRKEGIRHLERLAGRLWTDFNAHDPGVTILEQICYAITDLAYRANHEISDLLAKKGEESFADLYGPAQIMTTSPVTETDLRKLVIDIPGVKNAWVERIENDWEKVDDSPIPIYFNPDQNTLNLEGESLAAEPVYLKGLYRVIFELSDLLYLDGTEKDKEAVRTKVVQRLHENRALCQDFSEIVRLDSQGVQVHARIEIAAVDNAEDILLEIYQRIADHISPPIRFLTIHEMLDSGKRMDEIFDGPLLEHGFINDDALAVSQRKTVLHTSDFIREIMDVDGVMAVRDVQISTGAGKAAWSLKLDPKRTPRLDLEGSSLSLERNRLPVSVDKTQVERDWNAVLRKRIDFKPPAEDLEIKPPVGQDRNLDAYYSIQHQLPATYGVGHNGLSASASPERKAQAQQLKAYLLFFDQILAQYFSQLSHVRSLFSFSESARQTYFAQAIDDPTLALDDVYRQDFDAYALRLQEITENPYESGQKPDSLRRNKFLNHMLARFAEQFTDYSLVIFNVLSKSGASAPEKLMRDKQRFLQDYPKISSARGGAFNYLSEEGLDNRSGLKERISRKLGVGVSEGNSQTNESEEFYLVEHILLRPMAQDIQQKVPFLAKPQYQDPWSFQVSFVFPDWPVRYADAGFRTFIERVVREETPAHLVAHIHWLDQAEMTTFKVDYQQWLKHRREFWLSAM